MFRLQKFPDVQHTFDRRLPRDQSIVTVQQLGNRPRISTLQKLWKPTKVWDMNGCVSPQLSSEVFAV